MAKLSRIGLLSAIVLPVITGHGEAASWLERSNAIAQPWDLPFVAQPRSEKQKTQRRSRNSEIQAGRQRELQRTPALNLAPAEHAPTANVFPPPRPPAVAAPPAPDEPATAQLPATVGERSREPAAPRDRSRQAAPAPARDRSPQAAPTPAPARDRNQQSVASRERDADRNAEQTVERNLEQQLKRELPRLQAPATPVPPEQLACAERLAKIARYEPLPVRSGPNGCGAPDLVKLESVLLPDKSSVTIDPSPQIRCGMAVEVAEWIREEVSPVAAAELGSPLASITGNDAYECRTRNHVKGAKISEHGRGNAFDLATFRLKNGGVFNFTDPLVAKPFRERVRAAACARFMTVLGPGSDAYHAQHIHLDMAERSSRNAKVCQWEVREVQVAARAEPQPAETAQPEAAHDPDVTSPTEVDSPIADVVSPPLPRRKPEALLARAQMQSQTDGKRQRGGFRSERAEWSFRNREFRFRFRW